MSSKMETGLRSVLAPLSGQSVPLEQVPDDVFSQKILGDGIAILPTDGKLYAPVNGEIASVAETRHAYGFTSEDGLEILVHVGLESVALKGEGFTSHVKVGDKVKAGQLVAEVDLEFLKSKNVPLITPVLICEGAEDVMLNKVTGDVQAGKTRVIKLGINHDIDDATVAGIMSEDDIPLAIRHVLGTSKSSRINTLVLSCINNSDDDIRLDPGIQQAFDELHTFMFAKVYTNPACKSEEKKAVELVQSLYYHFAKKAENLPPQFKDIIERDGIGVAACDFIAGMTDRYAVRVFNELYVPKAWSENNDLF